MGGLLHLFDFHNNTFSKKSNLNPKIHDEDLEAPRNSFELLQADNFHTYEDKTKSYEFEEEEEEWYERGCYPIEESMKKKIINELSKHSNQTTPSLVAKLMGMDSLPLHSPNSTNWTNPPTKSNQKLTKKSTKNQKKAKLSLSSSMESEENLITPLQIRREHPQEEELQRFRREFEAWQSNKTSKIVEESSQNKNLFTRTRSFGRDFDKNSSTKIVILRPGPQKVYEFEDSLTTSSSSATTTMEETSNVSKLSIEEFLEEVKERLKGEIQGKQLIQRSSSVRGSGIETPFSERPSPKSEFITETQYNALDSPEFISKDTRKLLAERLRNVLRQEISPQDDLKTRTTTRLQSSVSSDVESLRKLTDDQLNRSGLKKESSLGSRNLKRSLSAPVSGTSFGKLLLEDRHVLTGVKIVRKHEEAITEEEEEVSVVIDPIRRKERFNLRKKVSSFRSSLRGRIFGKKIRSMIESNSFEDESIKDFVTGSSRFNGFYDRNENSTEVPPSPASVCSSTPDEYWRNIDYLSPISTPDVTVTDENGMPQVFRDISSNLSELRRQINELESDVRTPLEQESNQEIETIDLTNPDKVFVRDLLVASGLYDGTLDITMSRWDPLAKPINKSLLQETKHKRNNQEFDEIEEEDHNMLFDLLNEALAMVLGPLNYKKNLVNIKGKNLLESTWKIMSEYLYVQTTEKPFCSLDGIIGWDLEKFPWSCLISEEVNVLGKEIEGLIMVDLVEEIVKDLRI